MNDRTRVYIDGFNLYYGCVKGTPHRWLDVRELCRRELPNNQITMIRYFTAPIIPNPNQPGDGQNQRTYLRALAALPDVDVIEGHFLKKRTRGYLIDPISNMVTTRRVDIEVPEEKGTDVNIASYLLFDAMWGLYDVAVVISNDSDLSRPIEIAAKAIGKTVGVLSQSARSPGPYSRPLRSTGR